MNANISHLQAERAAGVNPLIGDNIEDTASRVAAVLQYLRWNEPDNIGRPADRIHNQVMFGRNLIYDSMIAALENFR